MKMTFMCIWGCFVTSAEAMENKLHTAQLLCIKFIVHYRLFKKIILTVVFLFQSFMDLTVFIGKTKTWAIPWY